MAKTERSFTNAELVNRKPAVHAYWPTRPGHFSRHISRLSAGSTMQGKAGLKKLAKLGIR